jgi:hypothetical protein
MTFEIGVLAVCNRLDTSLLTLPVDITDRVELDIANEAQVAAIREPLRLLERRSSEEAVARHDRATVLDRRFHLLDWSLDSPAGTPRSPEEIALAREMFFGDGGWIEPVGDDGRAVAVTYDLTAVDSYHVLRLASGDPQRVWAIWTGLQLLESPLQVAFGLTWMQGPPPEQNCGVEASGWLPAWLDGSVEELRDSWSTERLSKPLRIDGGWLADARLVIDAIENLAKGDWPVIFSALARRAELRSAPARSLLRHLGYFIVIESLLTHAPAITDPADSISRQLQAKIPLLSHRMERPVPFEEFDDNADPVTLLKALYQYRSSIAHGAPPEFSGKGRVLVSGERVGRFLEVTTRRLLRQAVLEPRLVTDLKGPARTSS